MGHLNQYVIYTKILYYIDTIPNDYALFLESMFNQFRDLYRRIFPVSGGQFNIPIEILKSIGCDYFNLNIKMGVPQIQLIVYSDVGSLESHCAHWRAIVKDTQLMFIAS